MEAIWDQSNANFIVTGGTWGCPVPPVTTKEALWQLSVISAKTKSNFVSQPLFDSQYHAFGLSYYAVTEWKYFPHNGPFVRGIHRPPVDWSTPKRTVEQIIGTPMIWDAIALFMTSL